MIINPKKKEEIKESLTKLFKFGGSTHIGDELLIEAIATNLSTQKKSENVRSKV